MAPEISGGGKDGSFNARETCFAKVQHTETRNNRTTIVSSAWWNEEHPVTVTAWWKLGLFRAFVSLFTPILKFLLLGSSGFPNPGLV